MARQRRFVLHLLTCPQRTILLLRGDIVLELLAGWLASDALEKFIQRRFESHTDEAAEKGALAILKRFALKREDGKLPENHDLENASRGALRKAARQLVLGIAARLDPAPPLFAAIREHLKNGTLTAQPLIQLRHSPEKEWLDKLQALCEKDVPFARLASAAIPAETKLLEHRVDQAAQHALSERFTAWIAHELQDAPGRPNFLDDFLQHGWPIEKDSKQRVTLYEAWCMFFREELKHKSEVFRILVANTVVETANDVKELRALAQQQPSLDDFHQWMGLRFGALQDWLDVQFKDVKADLGQIKNTQYEHHAETLAAIREITVAPTQPTGKPRNLAFATIGHLFKGRDDKIVELHNKLQSKRPVVVHGLGGVGKTRFTTEYALRYENDYAALCTLLGLPEHEAKEQDVQVSAVLRWLNAHPN